LLQLDRKIAAELAPKQENPNDDEEIKKDNNRKESTGYSTEANEKKTMVAESREEYCNPETETRNISYNILSQKPRRGII